MMIPSLLNEDVTALSVQLSRCCMTGLKTNRDKATSSMKDPPSPSTVTSLTLSLQKNQHNAYVFSNALSCEMNNASLSTPSVIDPSDHKLSEFKPPKTEVSFSQYVEVYPHRLENQSTESSNQHSLSKPSTKFVDLDKQKAESQEYRRNGTIKPFCRDKNQNTKRKFRPVQVYEPCEDDELHQLLCNF
mmetsp:Transcript_3652/g.5373  ORF Transcript_3652/g.5373 Transcript_3652/m.5373 type:complete len:188 (+) Transcript_3652:83-646(+)